MVNRFVHAQNQSNRNKATLLVDGQTNRYRDVWFFNTDLIDQLSHILSQFAGLFILAQS